MRISRILAATFATLLIAGAPALATTVWDEAVDGELSNDPDAPTALTLAVGANRIVGTIQAPLDPRDFVTFEIAPGQSLVGLSLIEYTDVATGGPGNRGFHAINAGAVSFIPGPATAANFLGGAHLDPLAPGTDLLPALAAASLAGSGFSVPLGPGTYAYVLQQTGTPLTRYAVELIVVPEPSAAVLLALAAAPLARRRALKSPNRMRRAARREVARPFFRSDAKDEP